MTGSNSGRSVRTGAIVGVAVLGLLAAFAVLAARGAAPGKAPAAAASKGTQNSCAVCLERRPLLLQHLMPLQIGLHQVRILDLLTHRPLLPLYPSSRRRPGPRVRFSRLE